MKKRLLRYLIAIVLVLPVVTIVAIHTALRSERFVIGYLLPFISEKAGTQIQASHSSIKLFSSIDLEGLSVGGASKDSKSRYLTI